DVFADKRIDRRRIIKPSHGMQQRDTVVLKAVVQFAEELGVVSFADMLEHANRDDAVESSFDIPVGSQFETRDQIQPLEARPLVGKFELLLAQGNAEYLGAGVAHEIETETSPSAAYVQDPEAWPVEIKLPGDVGLLVPLGLFQRLPPSLEIGT